MEWTTSIIISILVSRSITLLTSATQDTAIKTSKVTISVLTRAITASTNAAPSLWAEGKTVWWMGRR
jgi:hypothetical protein